MIPKPKDGDAPAYMMTYINYVGDDVMAILVDNSVKIVRLFQKLSPEQQLYRYAEGKWTAKEMVLHLIDSERVFQYRALRLARTDKTDLPGFDQDLYVAQSRANDRTMESLLAEYGAVRASTLSLFQSFEADVWHRTGTANGAIISVCALANAIAGHELHHYSVYKKRYL